MEKNEGFNRNIFVRRDRLRDRIFNRRTAIIFGGAFFFTWLGFYLDRLSHICN